MLTLQALAIVHARYPNAHLTVAGAGAALEEALQYVQDNDIANVEFSGFVRGPQKALLYSQAHCYILPSYTEGMPLSVLEAMAFGLPVVTRPVGGLKDFFEDGRMGYLAESLSPEEFAHFIIKLIEDPAKRESMGRYNHVFAMKNFSAPIVAGRLVGIYQEVVK